MSTAPLVQSIYDRDRPRFDALLQQGGWDDDTLPDAFVAAVYRGPAWLEPLLEAGAEIDRPSSSGVTALLQAASHRSMVDSVRFLVDRGARNQPELISTPAALFAARDDALESLSAIIAATGTDLDARNVRGWTALMVAARNHQRRAVSLLIEAGAGIEVRDEAGMSPFHHAALGGDLGVLEQLEAAGADPLRPTRDGMTSLMLTVVGWGASRRHASRHDAMRWLCSRGVDVDARDPEGRTALLHAEGASVFRTLLELGADVDATDASGENPLLRAAQLGAYDERYVRPRNEAADRSAETIDLLLRAGADTNHPGLIARAAAYRCPQIVRRLVEAGAPVRDPEGPGHSPLMGCGDSFLITRFLISRGLRVDVRDPEGRTPLHHAAGMYRDVRTSLRWMVKRGADVDARDRIGQTPMMRASQTNRADTVEELLALGADRSLADYEGRTALDIARTRGTPAIVAVLTRSG